MANPSTFVEELNVGDLDRGMSVELLNNFWREYRSNKSIEGEWLRPFLSKAIILEPVAREGDVPEILHVGSDTLMADHYGEEWSTNPALWNSIPDRHLARLASTGFGPVIEGSEPTFYCFGVSVDMSTRGETFVIYERLAVVLRSPSGRCRRLLTLSSALELRTLQSKTGGELNRDPSSKNTHLLSNIWVAD